MGTSSASPCSMSYVCVVFSNRAGPSLCGEKPISLVIVWVVWEFPWYPLSPRLSLDVTHSWYWKFNLVMRNDQMELCLPSYLVVPFRLPLCLYVFYEASSLLSCHKTSQMAFVFSYPLIWDVLLYMCCFYWLMNKAVSANGLAE